MLGYNASANAFTLYNPWGFDQPGLLSWSQLEATCDGFVVATTAGSAPISSGNLQTPLAAAASGISAAVGAGSASPWRAGDGDVNVAAWTTVPAGETASAATPATPATTGETYENHPAANASYGSVPHGSAAKASHGPLAAGVDAVLGGEDLGRLFAG